MGCCGKNIARNVGKVGAITEGNLRLFINTYFRLPDEQCPMAKARRVACRGCESHTFMGKWEFGLWVVKNGGAVKFLAEIHDLTGWPMLPKQEYKKGAKLFCRVCKCWLPAKSHVAQERCPVGNPAWDIEI